MTNHRTATAQALTVLMCIIGTVHMADARVRSAAGPLVDYELWEKLDHSESLAYEPWPEYDENLIKENEIELAVQVKGKIKDRIVVSVDADEEQIKQKALSCEKVIAAMDGKEPRKIIVIKSRLVNIVT